MRFFVTIEGRTHEVVLGAGEPTVDGEPVVAELLPLPGIGVQSLLLDGASHRLIARRSQRGEWMLHVGGRTFRAEVLDERTRAIRAMARGPEAPSGPRALKAPMTGLVVRVEVLPGDVVARGQGLVIVEAMKMENELTAEMAGTVRAVHVEAGQAVEKDEVLLEFEEPTTTEEGGA